MRIVSIAAIAAVGLAVPVHAEDASRSRSYPVSASDRGPPGGPSYVVPVFASDPEPRLVSKASSTVVTAFSWTGCYLGTHVGGAVSEDRKTNSSGSSNDFNSASLMGGGQIGCNYQFSGRWVVGIESRAAATGLRNTQRSAVTNLATGFTAPAQFTLSNGFLASSTARLGYSFADCWLLYARGGGAWTHDKLDMAFTTAAGNGVDPSATSARAGWTIGTGVEWAFAQKWSATLEYNYADFGTHGVKLIDASNKVTVSGLSIKESIHTATVGVNRRF